MGNSGTWSGTLKVKPDISNAFYNGPGEYLFKVGRYTPSCGSPLWSTESTITLTGPTPTPTPGPTNTPVPTNTPTPKSTPTPTPKLSPTLADELSPTDEEVLGVSSDSAEIETPTPKPKELKIASETSNNLLPKLLIFIGVVFLVACAIVVSYPYLKKFKQEKPDE